MKMDNLNALLALQKSLDETIAYFLTWDYPVHENRTPSRKEIVDKFKRIVHRDAHRLTTSDQWEQLCKHGCERYVCDAVYTAMHLKSIKESAFSSFAGSLKNVGKINDLPLKHHI